MMRLERLLLSRYGLFTDHPIDFGAPSPGDPDLHVIYGENEAGKSTALAAFLDLLFGIPNQSPYNFRHSYATMRIEADIRIGDKTDRFVRVKKKPGLRDGHNRPVLEGVLANALGGMTRESYKAMFSLDDDTLEAGGDEILKSDGDLGELLFAGSAGLKGLSGTLKGLRENADKFYKKGAKKKGKLLDLKSQLSFLVEEKKKLDMAAPAYVSLVQQRAAARSSYDEAAAAVANLETARAAAERRLAALPWLVDIRRLREEVADLEALPEPPPTWFARIGVLLEAEPRLGALLKSLEELKKDLENKRAALPVDEAILALEDRIAQLDTLDARFITAEDDLPRRRDSLAALDGRIADILRELGKTDADPAELAIPAAVAGTLGALMKSWAGVEASRRGAAEALAEASAEADRAEEACNEDGVAADAEHRAAFARLDAALAAALIDDSRARLELHGKSHREAEAELGEKIEQLQPWSGDAEDLERVEAPEFEELEAWKTALEAAGQDIQRLESDAARLDDERAELAERANTTKTKTGVAADDEAAALRTARDEAWARHRAALNAETADVFEKRMGAHDAAADNRLAHADALARVQQAGEDLRAVEAKAKRNAEKLRRAQRRRRQVVDEITASVAAMIRSGAAGMPSDVSLHRLAAWTKRRAEILDKLAKARSEKREVERARDNEDRLRGRIAEALAAVDAARDTETDTESLVAAAQAEANAEKKRRAQAEAARGNLEKARAKLELHRGKAKSAATDADKWRRDWDTALSRCWLGGIDPTPGVDEAGPILDKVVALEADHRQRKELTHRIATMKRDRAKFVAEVGKIAELADEDFDAAQVLAHSNALKKRLAKEAARRERRSELDEEIEEVTGKLSGKFPGAARDMAELRAESAPMCEAFGVETLTEVDKKLRQTAHRAKLRKELSDREAQLVEAMRAASPQDAEAALIADDREALEAEAAEIEAKLEDAAARKLELFAELQRAGDALAAVGGEDDAARLEQERRTTLLEIEEGARDWLRIRLGVAAAKRAIDAYREAHRSSMMENASEAFRTISRGAYKRLESQPADKGEVLIGVPKGDGAKLAPEMSKGARFQLYLALRVAGYREFVDRHGPVPFIADDILETFDDFRAEETFKVFASMAEYGQVIYLSHHRHLCDIAREVCPSVGIHELPDPSAA